MRAQDSPCHWLTVVKPPFALKSCVSVVLIVEKKELKDSLKGGKKLGEFRTSRVSGRPLFAIRQALDAASVAFGFDLSVPSGFDMGVAFGFDFGAAFDCNLGVAFGVGFVTRVLVFRLGVGFLLLACLLPRLGHCGGFMDAIEHSTKHFKQKSDKL